MRWESSEKDSVTEQDKREKDTQAHRTKSMSIKKETDKQTYIECEWMRRKKRKNRIIGASSKRKKKIKKWVGLGKR